MILADCHVHSSFSDDCDAAVEQMIETAIVQGRKYFYITDHHDFDYPAMDDGVTFQLAQEPYIQRMEELKHQYKNKIDIRIGVELGLMAHIKEKTEAYAKAYGYDFIIGSSHLVNGIDPYYPEYYTDKNEYQAYEQYFLSILDNVKTYDTFHVYGHLDYIMRYVPNQTKPYDPMDYSDIFREILKTIIDNGKGIEVNTGSLYKGFDFPHPHSTILKMYKDLGGELITIGSDAHKPQYLGYGFEQAEALLKKCGFDSYTLFADGKPQQIKF
ncbi:MAG: histidinol-phosphatase HisJ family protein [Peptococcaceae bacterium]|nr:histidinol-phosphatase HisJ family protein [Peptococcaceae bacterium]